MQRTIGIDFITDPEGVLMPIEVKSVDNTKAKVSGFSTTAIRPKLP